MQSIIDKTAELKKLQATDDSPEDRLTIPHLELSDLTREVTEYPIAITKNEKNSGVTVIRHEMGSTSGIAYVGYGIDLSALSLDDINLLAVYSRLMMEGGAGEYDPVALSRRIGIHTGGISVSLLITPVKKEGIPASMVTDCTTMISKLIIKGKATSDNVDELFSIFNLILTDTTLDSKSKVIEMLKEGKSRLESGIQGSGHTYALNRMRSRYTAAGYIDEMMSGISSLDSIKALLKEAEEDWPSVLARLENIRKTIITQETARDGMFLDLTGDSKVLETIQPSVESFLQKLPGDSNGAKLPNFYKEQHPWAAQATKKMTELAPVIDEGFIVPTQVSYVGKGGLIFDKGEAVRGSDSVVSRFLRTGYLWDNVRVIGGAYGGFCVFAQGSGFFGFLSYRDPNLSKTLDVYDAAADALMAAADDLEKDPEALATAIIGAIGDMDGAKSPDQKGWTAFNRWISNESAEDRQLFRDEILNTKASDFRDFAERLRNVKQSSIAVVSSKAAFEVAAKDGKQMKLIEIV